MKNFFFIPKVRSLTTRKIIFKIGIGFLLPTPLNAKFLIEDTRQVDQEERLSSETYNDIYSYRYPLSWGRKWNSSLFGYRVNAGSLNAKRFEFEEDIKAETGRYESFGFFFNQTRHENFLEERLERDIRVRARLDSGLYFAMFADGGKYKQFGDVGFALGLDASQKNNFEIYYISVDHYYKSKKLYDEDSRSRDIFSYGVKGNHTIQKIKLTHFYEFDAPFIWYRNHEKYHYDYSRSVFDVKVSYFENENDEIYLEAKNEWKSEGKLFTSSGNLKKYSRFSKIFELGRKHFRESNDVSYGFTHIYRFAKYQHMGDLESHEEGISPDFSERKEMGLFISNYFKDLKPALQIGIFSNRVFIHLPDGGKKFEWETKGQIFWDMEMNKHARMVLNTTWDFDQLYKDYPYSGEKTFKPWGGGNIQFIAVF